MMGFCVHGGFFFLDLQAAAFSGLLFDTGVLVVGVGFFVSTYSVNSVTLTLQRLGPFFPPSYRLYKSDMLREYVDGYVDQSLDFLVRVILNGKCRNS
ncbi:hypothetical protein QBC41DRAFT_11142 [Cercophora samala]|uniref:Uncharacterized protein n=1 Tax=Cercophora samala TaxID=330535 RepID=A0AA39Z8H6_9PEZI|nr:hypothetical protein QBC41DRAFT_11142 [Cercophora samala]